MTEDFDDSMDEGIDPEGPDESEMDSSDEPDLEVCPHCRKMIYEDTEQCPHCGYWISSSAQVSKPVWVVIAALVCILLMLLYAL